MQFDEESQSPYVKRIKTIVHPGEVKHLFHNYNFSITSYYTFILFKIDLWGFLPTCYDGQSTQAWCRVMSIKHTKLYYKVTII